MYIPIYVDGQSVILLDGPTANIDLEYNENTDEFEVTADCSNWEDDFRNCGGDDENDETIIEEARDCCKMISGKYGTLREINRILDKYCEHGSWYEFTWEYDDGTPVE